MTTKTPDIEYLRASANALEHTMTHWTRLIKIVAGLNLSAGVTGRHLRYHLEKNISTSRESWSGRWCSLCTMYRTQLIGPCVKVVNSVCMPCPLKASGHHCDDLDSSLWRPVQAAVNLADWYTAATAMLNALTSLWVQAERTLAVATAVREEPVVYGYRPASADNDAWLARYTPATETRCAQVEWFRPKENQYGDPINTSKILDHWLFAHNMTLDNRITVEDAVEKATLLVKDQTDHDRRVAAQNSVMNAGVHVPAYEQQVKADLRASWDHPIFADKLPKGFYVGKIISGLPGWFKDTSVLFMRTAEYVYVWACTAPYITTGDRFEGFQAGGTKVRDVIAVDVPLIPQLPQ